LWTHIDSNSFHRFSPLNMHTSDLNFLKHPVHTSILYLLCACVCIFRVLTLHRRYTFRNFLLFMSLASFPLSSISFFHKLRI
jgi:hypothetical protein